MGETPTVIHVRRFMTEEELFGTDKDTRMELEELGYNMALQSLTDARISQLFGDTPLSAVTAIILPLEPDNRPGGAGQTPWSWLIERLPEDIARYRVREKNLYRRPHWLESLGSDRYGGKSLPFETTARY